MGRKRGNSVARILSLVFALAAALPLSLTKAGGQDSTTLLYWPPVTRQTKPWSRWWWHGSAVNERDLTAEMEKYQKAGLGGLEITPIYGVRGAEDRFIDFLSPAWMGMLERTLKEADRLGMGVRHGDRHRLAFRRAVGRGGRRVQEFLISNSHVEGGGAA